MRHAAAPILAVLLVLAGCASTKPATPAPVTPPAPTPEETAAAALARVVPLVETATVASLTQAASQLASTAPGQAGSAKNASLLESAAAAIFTSLYPELDSPFPAAAAKTSSDTSSGEAEAEAPSSFLAEVLPALVLVGPGTTIDQALAATLTKRLDAADALNSTSVLPPYLRAELVESTGGPAATERPLLEEALRRDPGFYPAGRLLAGLVISSGTASTELPRLEQLAGLFPTAPLRFAALARAELAGGQAQKAADAAAQGLLAAPDDTDFVLLRADALEKVGDWYQSLWILDAALKLQPDLVAGIAMKARLLYEDEQNAPEALRVLDDAETRFPNDPTFPELRGRILLGTGSSDEGVAALKRALAIAPGRTTTLSLLLGEAAGDRRWTEAQSWLEKIPDAARSTDDLRLGWKIFEGLGNHDEAIKYARAIGSRGSADEALELEIRSLVAAGRTADALTAVDKALAATVTVTSPELKSTLLTLRAAAGSPDPLSDLRQALLANSENGEALSAIADLLLTQGELRKASEYAKQAAALDPHNADLAKKATDLAARAESGN